MDLPQQPSNDKFSTRSKASDSTKTWSAEVPTDSPPLHSMPPGSGPEDLPERIGRYRIVKLLGKGGFGVVYLGGDEVLDRLVAIKVPLPHRVADIEGYITEARILASLDHPNIVTVHDAGRTDDGACFVVSKYIAGSNLRARMDHERLSPTGAAEIVATVAEALHCAHKNGVVHRDIKPENILIDSRGIPYVADFGIALRDENFAKEPDSSLVGSPTYMSPEQAKGRGHLVDGRSDIFSLGVVFYELLTGVNPFRSASWTNSLLLIATVDPKPPRQINDSIPIELESACLRALAKQPTDRFTTAEDFADELRKSPQHGQGCRPSTVQANDTPRVFGVGFRRLSQGQFGCALVVGTLVLLLAALPALFQTVSPDTPHPGTVKVDVTSATHELRPRPSNPPDLWQEHLDLTKIVKTVPPPEPPAPALPRRAPRVGAPQTELPKVARTEEPSTHSKAFSEVVARSLLSEKGILVSHSGLSLVDEKELGPAFNVANSFKRKLLVAAKKLQAAERNIEELQDDLRERHRNNVELNAQLASPPRTSVEHNRLVGEINANSSAINLIMQQQEQLKKEIDVVRKETNTAREEYVRQIEAIHKLVDRLAEQYTALKSDSDARSALGGMELGREHVLRVETVDLFSE